MHSNYSQYNHKLVMLKASLMVCLYYCFELYCARSFKDDKIEGKIMEIDNVIPPNVGMTNYTYKIFLNLREITNHNTNKNNPLHLCSYLM